MADEMNQNVAILSLMAALKDNSKELTAQTKKMVSKIEKNAGTIEFGADTEEIQKAIEKINKLIDGKLKGIDLTKQFSSILKVFSSAESSAEDYLNILDKVHNELSSISKLPKNSLDLMGDFSPKQINQVLKVYDKLIDKQEQYSKKLEENKKRAQNVEVQSLISLKKEFGKTPSYKNASTDGALELLSKQIGLKNNTSAKDDIKEYSQLLTIFNLLQDKKKELAKINTAENALEEVKINKTLLKIVEEITTKEKRLSTAFKAKDLLSSSLDGFDTGEINRSILRSVDEYSIRATSVVKDSIKKLQNELDQTILDYSQKNVDRMVSAQEKASEKVKARIEKRIPSTISTQEGVQDDGSSVENLGVSVKETLEVVDQLDSTLDNIGSGSDSEELDLWTQSAENLKEEFADVIKYAVDAETALKKVALLNKELDKRTLSDEEIKDLVGYSQRAISLDLDLTENQEDTFYDYADDYKKMSADITRMTEKQLAEIEKLKVAQKEVAEQPIDSSSTSTMEKKVEKTTESVKKLTQAETEVIEQANKIENEFSNIANEEDIKKLTTLVEDFNSKSQLKIDVDIQEAIVNTETIQEKIDKLPEIKDIEIRIHDNDYSSTPLLSDEEGKVVTAFRGVTNAWSGLINDKGISFFTDKLELAADYADSLAESGKIYSANLSFKNPLEVDGKGSIWNEIEFDGVKRTTDEIVQIAKQLGHDGIIFKNIRDGFADTDEDISNVMVALNKAQIKNEQVVAAVKAGSGKITEVVSSDNKLSTNIEEQQKLQIELQETEQQAKETATALGNINQTEVLSGDAEPYETKREIETVEELIGSHKELINSYKELSNIKDLQSQKKDGNYSQVLVDGLSEAMVKMKALYDAGETESLEYYAVLSRIANIQKEMWKYSDGGKTAPADQLSQSNKDYDNRLSLQDGILQDFMQFKSTTNDVVDFVIQQFSDMRANVKGSFIGLFDDSGKILSQEMREQASIMFKPIVNQTPLSLVEESSGQLSMFEGVEEQQKEIKQSVEQTNDSIEGQINLIDYLNEQASKSNTHELVQESSGQLAMFEGLEESQKEVETSIEKTNDAIKGQITIEEYQKNQVKETANAYDELTKKLDAYYKLKNKQIKGTLGKDKPSEVSDLADLETDIQNAILGQEKYANAIGEAAKSQENFNNKLKEYAELSGQNFIADANSKLDKAEGATGKTNAYAERIAEIRKTINDLDLPIDFTDDAEVEKLKQARAYIYGMIDSLKGDEFKSASKELDDLSKKVSRKINVDTAAPKELRQELIDLNNRIEQFRNSVEGVNKVQVDKLRKEFSKLEAQIEATGKTGASMGDKIAKKFKDVAAYFATYVSIQDAIQVIRQGFETINEYDKALTEMNKVSDESIQTLKEFQKESFGLADSIGTTASQIQNSTADFMRLGESLEQAKASAQDANILFNVSEFETIDEATSSLVSMSQAFKDLEKGEIVDVVNNLGNNFAISTDGLATALKDSASSLQTAQNDFYEAAALTTAANTVVQDPAKVGAGLRTIALRLTGTEAAREELQALGEDVDDFVVTTTSKMDQQIRDLTKTQGNFGVSLLDMNGNYRSTYDVLLDIAKVWDKIAEEDLVTGENRQNALLEMMAGKNRSNILASILQSPDVLEEAYAYALDSEGSALKENEAYLESIQGHLDQLKNSWDNLWINENNREVITFFLDLAKSVLDAANEFGALNTILVGGGGIFAAIKAFQGNGRPKCRVSKLNMPLVA